MPSEVVFSDEILVGVHGPGRARPGSCRTWSDVVGPPWSDAAFFPRLTVASERRDSLGEDLASSAIVATLDVVRAAVLVELVGARQVPDPRQQRARDRDGDLARDASTSDARSERGAGAVRGPPNGARTDPSRLDGRTTSSPRISGVTADRRVPVRLIARLYCHQCLTARGR